MSGRGTTVPKPIAPKPKPVSTPKPSKPKQPNFQDCNLPIENWVEFKFDLQLNVNTSFQLWLLLSTAMKTFR